MKTSEDDLINNSIFNLWTQIPRRLQVIYFNATFPSVLFVYSSTSHLHVTLLFLTSTSLKNWKLLLFIPCEISAVWTWDLLKRSGFVSRIEEQNMFPKNEGKNMQSANKTVSSPLSSFNRGAKPIDCWEVWQNYCHLSIFSSEN